MDHISDVSVVYFIRIGNGQIKIGVAGYLPHRLPKFEAANGYDLEVVAAIPGGIERERELHRMFEHCRISREKFAEGPVLDWLRDQSQVTNNPRRNGDSIRSDALDEVAAWLKKHPGEGLTDRQATELVGHKLKQYSDLSTYQSRACKKMIKRKGLVRDNSCSPVLWKLLD